MLSDLNDEEGGQPVRIMSKAAAGQAPKGAASSVFSLAATLVDKPDVVHDASSPAAPAPTARSPWNAGRSAPLYIQILELMSDGAERTTQEMADALTTYPPKSVRDVAYLLAGRGQLDARRADGEKFKRFRIGAGVNPVPAARARAPRAAPAPAPVPMPATKKTAPIPRELPDDGKFLAALYSDGVLWIQAGDQQISLLPAETSALRRYLSAVSSEATP